MLNKLYNKLNSIDYTTEIYNNAIHLYTGEKEVHVYTENNQLEIYLFDNDECIESDFFDNENTAYYHIRGFLY